MSLRSAEFGEQRDQEEGPGLPHATPVLDGSRSEGHDTQRALINILDDLTAEQTGFEDGQRALLNILDDLTAEQANFEDGQKALLNILEDSEIEKKNLEGAQSAVLNILEDFDLERAKVEAVNRDLYKQVEERRRAQREIRELNRVLEQRVSERTSELAATNKELEAFAYSVSHDLRAPLRHMDGFLALFMQRAENLLDEQSRRYLNKVTAASQTMGTLIDDLLQFSRMGRSEFRKTMVSLERIVEGCRQELEVETTDRSVRWVVGSLPEVVADAAMLKLVMTNLLSNALKFTRRCSEARIEIGTAAGNPGEVVIFVKDNGVGFDMQFVDKLFNVFQRLHHVKDFEGTGIGLANVRRIVERHGGRVWAEGAENAGAAIYFSLPKIELETVVNEQ